MDDLNKQVADELFGGKRYSATDTREIAAGVTGADIHYNTFPDWEHSVDAALRLPIESDAKWVLEVEVGRPVAHLIRTYGQNVWMGVRDKEPTLAACMCKVWLLYRKHMRDYALAD